MKLQRREPSKCRLGDSSGVRTDENAHERGTCSSYLGQVRKAQLASLLGKIFFGYKELKELRRSRNKELDEMGQEYSQCCVSVENKVPSSQLT